jgi:hypothetical protein
MHYSDVFDEPLQISNMILVNTPTAHRTVKAQVYRTGTGGVAHAYRAGVLYRWDEKDMIESRDGDDLF